MADSVPAQKAPYQATIEAGKKYAWCACGRSQAQPFCDGSHKGTGIQPIVFQADETKEVWFCGCKATANQPYCDGSHSNL